MAGDRWLAYEAESERRDKCSDFDFSAGSTEAAAHLRALNSWGIVRFSATLTPVAPLEL